MRDLICVICEGDGNFELKWTSGGRYWRAPIYCTQRWRDNFVDWNKTGKLSEELIYNFVCHCFVSLIKYVNNTV